jgi:hypothetical protein
VLVSWQPVYSATQYQVARSADGVSFTTFAPVTATSLNDGTAAANTSYLYKVQALDAVRAGPYSGVDLATTVLFSDDPIVAGTTIVKAAHFEELRAAVNAVRRLAGLAPAPFADALTTIKAAHMNELRSNLDTARSSLGLQAMTYGEAIIAGTAMIKASHVTELRDRVR